MEVWKDLEGYEGIYQISNLGRVKSLERTISQGWGYRTISEKILTERVLSNGYKHVYISLNGKKKCLSIHRLVATAFIPNPENKPQVNHINCNKIDNNVLNLEWCTAKENMKHAKDNNLIKKQSRKGRFSNSSKKVIDVKTGKIYHSVREASEYLKCSQSFLSRMLTGKRKNKTTLIYYNEAN